MNGAVRELNLAENDALELVCLESEIVPLEGYTAGRKKHSENILLNIRVFAAVHLRAVISNSRKLLPVLQELESAKVAYPSELPVHFVDTESSIVDLRDHVIDLSIVHAN